MGDDNAEIWKVRNIKCNKLMENATINRVFPFLLPFSQFCTGNFVMHEANGTVCKRCGDDARTKNAEVLFLICASDAFGVV